jgi:hypothetical protein
MKILFLIVLSNCVAFAQTTKINGAWIPVQMHWVHAPPQINPKLETGEAAIIFFGRDGQFVVVQGVINREAGRYMTLSQGDGQVIFLGKWNGILPGKVIYRLTSRSVALEGEKLPGPWHEEHISIVGNGYLVFQGTTYRRASDLGKSVCEALHQPIVH